MLREPNIHLVLDTHIFLWLMEGDSHISKKSVEYIESIVENEFGIAVCAISLWEISMLHARKRILLNQPCLNWINHSLQAPGIHLIDLTPEMAVDSCSLPNHFHGDPADRMIIATARILDVPLMTYDEKILSYSRQGFIRCIEG